METPLPTITLTQYRMTLYKDVTLFGSVTFLFLVWITSFFIVGVWYCAVRNLPYLKVEDFINITVLSFILTGVLLLYFTWQYKLVF
jgi:hypothetical protein